MNQTPNYQLYLWEGEDRILREDFNADNAKIEAAIQGLETNISQALAAAGNCKIATGSYVGTGATGAASPNQLTFAFTPQIVFLDVAVTEDYNTAPQYYILLRPAEYGFSRDTSSKIVLNWSEYGVSWYSPQIMGGDSYQFNVKDQTYHYIAIGM